MSYQLAEVRACGHTMGIAALLVAAATPALIALDPILPSNLVWLGYLMPVIFVSVRWGFAGAATAAVIAGLAGDFFFTHPYYSFWMDDPREVTALLLFLLAGFSSALVITNSRQANDRESRSVPALQKLGIELSECQTSPEVIRSFSRWLSFVARGRATIFQAHPVDSEGSLVPEEVQRVATGMCGTRWYGIRTVASAANRRWHLAQLRSEGMIRGTLVVEAEIDTCDSKLVEAATTKAATRFSELAHRESLTAAADCISDPKFSNQWRTSLTTILGAASVLQMGAKVDEASRVQRTLLEDIRDEAVNLGQLLTNAFSASRATAHETPYCADCTDPANLLDQCKPGMAATAKVYVEKKSASR